MGPGISGGSVVWILDADTGQFDRALISSEAKAKDFGKSVQANAQKPVQSFGQTLKGISSQASTAFGSVANSIAAVGKIAVGVFTGGALSLGVFIKQASDLQSIRASFESMTGSAKQATQVLQQLNKFSFETAFSSSDINNAARTLLGAGLQVKDLGATLKNIGDIAGATGANLGQLTLPLSQSLARGKLQTQDFYQILNSGAGKLGQVLRKELAERGFKDFGKAMEDGKITSKILFDVIAKSARKGGFAFQGAIKQSKTFSGQMSNLQEMIGNVALKILGVNKATGEIDQKGIFAKLSKAVQDATEWLSKNQDTIAKVAKVIIDNAVPAITAIGVAFTVAKVAAIGFAIAASPISAVFFLIAGAITALVAVVTFLQVKFNIFGKTWDFIKSTWGQAVSFFQGIWKGISKAFGDIGKWFSDRFTEAKNAIIKAFNDIVKSVKKSFDKMKKFIDDHKEALTNIGIVIGTLLLPKFTQLAIQATKSLGKVIAQFTLMGASATKNAVISSAAWIKSAVLSSAAFIKEIPKIVAQFVIASTQAVINSVKASAAWIKSAIVSAAQWAVAVARIVAGFVLIGVQALIAGGKIAASWLLAMGPIGLVVAAVIGAVALIIANWAKVKAFVGGVWTAIVKWAQGAWKSIQTTFGRVASWFGGIFGGAVSAIKGAFSRVIGFFQGIWTSIKSIFGKIGKSIGDAIGGAFKGVINGIIGFVESTVNGVIKSINAVAEGIDKALPGDQSGWRVPQVKLPRLADGGIVMPRTGGTAAILGEAGQAEAVIPLSKLDNMINGTGGNGITNNIDTINIGTEVDGERWLSRLTRESELQARGLSRGLQR